MAEPLLALRSVRAGYGEAVVLDDVSFEVPEQGRLAVLGRNGVGKSTLLLTIMGHTDVGRGTIVWRGADITAVAPHRRARGGTRLGGAGARGLPLADRRGEPDGRRPAGPVGPGRPSTSSFRRSSSGGATWAATSRAASSRCSPSRAR